MQLRERFLLSFGAVVLVLILIGLTSGLILFQTRSALESIESQRFFKEHKINRARLLVLTIHGEILHEVMFYRRSIEDAEKHLDSQARDFYRLLRELSNAFPEKRDDIEEIHASFQSFYIFAKRVLKLSMVTHPAPKGDVLKLFKDREEELLKIIDEDFSSYEKELDQTFLALNRHLTKILQSMFALVFIGIVFSLGLSFVLARALSSPIRDLIRNIRQVERDGVALAAPSLKQFRSDELGELAEAFDRMVNTVKQKQDSLARAERRYREIFENAAEGIVQTTPEGRLLSVNPAVLKLFGYESSEELFGSVTNVRTQIYIRPEDRDSFMEIMYSGEIVHNFETEMLCRDGSTKWVRMHARPVFDEQGLLTRIDTILDDISEAKLAREELRKYHNHLESLVLRRTNDLDQRNGELASAVRALESSNQWLQGLMDNSPSSVFLKDLDKAFILANNRFMETFTPLGAVEGRENQVLFKDTLLDFFDDLDEILLKESDPWLEEKTLDLGGQHRVFSVMLFPILDHSQELRGYGCMLTDITHDKMLQSESIHAAQLVSIGEMAAGVAHEINNPINGIINYAQLIIDTENQEFVPWAEDIMNEAERVANIVRSLLSFARKQTTTKTLASAEDILQECLKLTGNDLRIHDVETIVKVQGNLPKILVNFTEMQQVFINLIFNARQAMVDKKSNQLRSLIIRASSVLSEIGPRVRVSFEDNGSGMPEHVARRVFEPFYTTRGATSGVGLGLFLCHKIVTDHGGRIEIQSLEGVYTRMTVDLPTGE